MGDPIDDGDPGDGIRSESGCCDWDAATPADTTGGACERRRRKKMAPMTMVITAIPPTAPPAMAAALELLPPECGVPPMTSLGRTSGVSIKRSEIVTRGKTGETMLTTGGIRFVGVPSVLGLECVVITVLQRKL